MEKSNNPYNIPALMPSKITISEPGPDGLYETVVADDSKLMADLGMAQNYMEVDDIILTYDGPVNVNKPLLLTLELKDVITHCVLTYLHSQEGFSEEWAQKYRGNKRPFGDGPSTVGK
jgi:hypothetical protein